jgi:signal transduction histidine kinase
MLHRFCLLLFILLLAASINAQSIAQQIKLAEARSAYKTATDPAKKLDAALTIINRYSGVGGAFDDTAQRLIYVAKEFNQAYGNDTINYYLQIWQTEIFYYAGLYQFGISSAEKQISYGQKIKDSFLIGSAYFFKAINLLELDSFQSVKLNLDKALAFYPTYKPKITYRKLAYHNQLINVYAENFFEQNLFDSALYYNSLALHEAYQEQSLRGMPAGHLVQGKIFFELNKFDSADFHFNKTIQLGKRNSHMDLVLTAYGKQALLHKQENGRSKSFVDSGLALIEKEVINNSFKSFFYKDAIAVLQWQGDINTVQRLQTKLLAIKDNDTKLGNELVQNITTQMVDNETRLLKLQLEDFEKQKKLRNLQLLILVLFSGLLISIFLFVLRRNRARYSLLQQKAMIARELHDDVGASISSIAMYAEVVSQRLPPGTNAQLPLNNISHTVQEISGNLKDIIWFILPQNETFEKLVDRIRHYAEPLCMEKDIHFTIAHQQHAKFNALSIADKKNIYLIIKEAINNALKYADAQNISLHFKQENNKLQIWIQDDGIGLEENIQYGNGIRNMQARANDLKGSIHFASNGGTKITLTL